MLNGNENGLFLRPDYEPLMQQPGLIPLPMTRELAYLIQLPLVRMPLSGEHRIHAGDLRRNRDQQLLNSDIDMHINGDKNPEDLKNTGIIGVSRKYRFPIGSDENQTYQAAMNRLREPVFQQMVVESRAVLTGGLPKNRLQQLREDHRFGKIDIISYGKYEHQIQDLFHKNAASFITLGTSILREKMTNWFGRAVAQEFDEFISFEDIAANAHGKFNPGQSPDPLETPLLTPDLTGTGIPYQAFLILELLEVIEGEIGQSMFRDTSSLPEPLSKALENIWQSTKLSDTDISIFDYTRHVLSANAGSCYGYSSDSPTKYCL